MFSHPLAVLSAVAVVAAVSLSGSTAHGVLDQPPPTMTKSTTAWVVQKANYWPEIGSKPAEMVTKFASLAKQKGVTVRDVLEEMAPSQKCGFTNPNGKRQPVPTNGLAVFRSNRYGGFGHRGPCEIWLDDKLVAHGDDCENDFPGGGDESREYSKIPVDYSSCKGACTLRFFWLAFQGADWQVYINCVPLQGNGGSGGPAPAPAVTTRKPAPAPAPAPRPTTAAPSPPATTPTTTMPAAVPKTSTPPPASSVASESKCRRLRV